MSDAIRLQAELEQVRAELGSEISRLKYERSSIQCAYDSAIIYKRLAEKEATRLGAERNALQDEVEMLQRGFDVADKSADKYAIEATALRAEVERLKHENKQLTQLSEGLAFAEKANKELDALGVPAFGHDDQPTSRRNLRAQLAAVTKERDELKAKHEAWKENSDGWQECCEEAEKQRDQAQAERDEERACGKRHLEMFAQAQADAAAMREALETLKGAVRFPTDELCEQVDAALSTNAGRELLARMERMTEALADAENVLAAMENAGVTPFGYGKHVAEVLAACDAALSAPPTEPTQGGGE